jgi:hypothetical protein
LVQRVVSGGTPPSGGRLASATPREAAGGFVVGGELPEGLQVDGYDVLALRAVKTRLYETCRVIAAKPTVCSRVRNAAGSTGL